MGNLFDEYPALLVLPEVLLAIVIVAAIVVMRRKPSPKRRVRQMRAIRPMPSDTVDPIGPAGPRNSDPAERDADDPLKREDWSDDRR
ncbi:hypothetical protein [Pandoraea apista]|uniref:Transmembrane protein n=1 Tax=Pandoraea apista TaxID=93218 RepID=A0A0G4JCK6_9BURK|nr:hypothetical protein [Pandoraea apista]ALS66736.1 hypothetical protein AT395_18705 [Pandoraea apista]PTD99960.1 hypothetical protein C7830_16125 [Pandoraea apista]RRJ27267.1 hypothetical protein EIB05_22780 [Pandoraea apista]RRJ72988.1 hypothetical protein EIL82_22930 [Pandoraea apista]RRW93474.1 hypothetical protein EGJ54_18455 [Pandoraea apista]